MRHPEAEEFCPGGVRWTILRQARSGWALRSDRQSLAQRPRPKTPNATVTTPANPTILQAAAFNPIGIEPMRAP